MEVSPWVAFIKDCIIGVSIGPLVRVKAPLALLFQDHKGLREERCFRECLRRDAIKPDSPFTFLLSRGLCHAYYTMLFMSSVIACSC